MLDVQVYASEKTVQSHGQSALIYPIPTRVVEGFRRNLQGVQVYASKKTVQSHGQSASIYPIPASEVGMMRIKGKTCGQGFLSGDATLEHIVC